MVMRDELVSAAGCCNGVWPINEFQGNLSGCLMQLRGLPPKTDWRPLPPWGGAPHRALGRTLGRGWGIEHPGFPSKASRCSCPQERFLEGGFRGHVGFDSSAFFFVFVCVLALNWGRGEERRPGSPCLPSHAFACALLLPGGNAFLLPSLAASVTPILQSGTSSSTCPVQVSQVVCPCWKRCPAPMPRASLWPVASSVLSRTPLYAGILALRWVVSALKDGPFPASVCAA